MKEYSASWEDWPKIRGKKQNTTLDVILVYTVDVILAQSPSFAVIAL